MDIIDGRLFALVLLFAGGCATVPSPHLASARPTGASHHDASEEAEESHPIPNDPATVARAEHVHVLASGEPDCPKDVEFLGPVDVHESVANEEAALRILRLRAAALGAEAITHVEFEHGDEGAPTHLSGVAVRCSDLLHGRTYTSLGPVEAIVPMGHEEEARNAIRAATRARGGNFTLDIRFEHGEGENATTRVTGTAALVHD